MKLVAGSPFEWVARDIFYVGRDKAPDRLLSEKASQERNYDRLTIEIARATLSNGDNSIDIGANAGYILKALTRISPTGLHWAFEPIPRFVRHLRKNFPNVTVEQIALSDHTGIADFHFLPRDPACSSLLTRPEIESGREVQLLRTRVRRLDDCIPESTPIAFIKIDVEGAEAGVLRGAVQLLRRCKPVVVFECSATALADCARPLDEAGLHISFLADYMADVRKDMSELMKIANESNEFYYVAAAG